MYNDISIMIIMIINIIISAALEPYRRLWKEMLPSSEPWPCDPSAETALQPMIWYSES